MPREPEAEGIIGTPVVRDQTADLPMFATPKPSPMVMPGAGQRARRQARDTTNVANGLNAVRKALDAATDGLTRVELAKVTGLPVNTINARVADLTKLREVWTEGTREALNDEGRMVNGSVVYLRFDLATTPAEGAA